MKKTKVAGLMFACMSSLLLRAQEQPMHCGTEMPSQQWEEQFQKEIADFVANKTANKSQLVGYTIPVIIHVIHGNQAVGTYPNLAQGQLNSQIQVLNNDFAGTGYNSGNYNAVAFAAWAATAAVNPLSLDGNGRVAIANTGVQFCMALKDPAGNILAEPGIERISYQSQGWQNPNSFGDYTSFKNFMDGTVKPNTIWDVTKYLNIWISDSDFNGTGGLLGYATFPPSSTLSGIPGGFSGTSTTDGFWCYPRAFGSQIVFPSGIYMNGYARGRTSTHEIGHWLGLRHIWGDGTCATDYCNDTPTAQTSNAGSPNYPYKVNVCSNSGSGEMFMNFMDYTNDAAKYMFTTDQGNRIQTAMANSPYRKFLGTHSLCTVASVPSTAMFSSNTNGCTGKGMLLLNESQGWPPPTYTWTCPGVTFTPNQQAVSPMAYFPGPGVYTINLASDNGTLSAFTKTVNVTSPVMAISATSQTICQGTSATFFANGLSTYTWEPGNVIGDMLVVTTPTANQTFTCTGEELNGCKTTTVVQVAVDPCVGIRTFDNSLVNVSVYPNPAKDQLNFQIDAALHSNVQVQICDALGRTVITQELNLSSTSYIHSFDVNTFDKGIYFVKVSLNGEAAKTVKFIKE